MSIVEATPAKRSTASSPAHERLWGKRDVADLFGIGLSTVDLWRRDGRLPKGLKVGKAVLWDSRVIRKIAGLE